MEAHPKNVRRKAGLPKRLRGGEPLRASHLLLEAGTRFDLQEETSNEAIRVSCRSRIDRERNSRAVCPCAGALRDDAARRRQRARRGERSAGEWKSARERASPRTGAAQHRS